MTRACKGGHQGRIAAERASVGSGTVDNEVEAPAVVRGDVWGGRVGEPLLRHDLSFGTHGLAGDAYPILARLASRPVLGHAKAWSPRASTISPHPGLGPQRIAQSGSAKHKRRLKSDIALASTSIKRGGVNHRIKRVC